MSRLIDYSKFSEPPKKKKIPSKTYLWIVFILILSLFIIYNNSFKRKANISTTLKPIASEVIDKGKFFLNPDENSEQLGLVVQKALNNSQGDYGVVVKNLKTGERYFYNEHKVFRSASLYKLFVMAVVFQKIQDGNLSQNDILTEDIAVLNKKFRISSESAELTEGDITLPVQSALSRMITISDNYSALLLTERVKLSQVALFLSQNALLDSKVGTNGESPTTSAYDISLFFQNLYKGEFADKALTRGMLALLKHQMLNTKIPKYLPSNIDISHKTGELDFLSHDAGIVFTSKGDYIISILSETNSPAQANENIAKISKAVYEYFVR